MASVLKMIRATVKKMFSYMKDEKHLEKIRPRRTVQSN